MPRKYPHLLDNDILLWERFLISPQNTFTYFEYDVRVGRGQDPGPDYPDNIRRMALDLSMRRIDAVAHNDHTITIIEISTEPGLTQIGQITAYPTLYRTAYDYTETILTLLIAETISTDLRAVLFTLKLPFLIYPKP